jgi:glycine hydroxymethyltransferase
MQPTFVEYQRAVLNNALVLASELKRLGMDLVSGGTDTHLVLMNLTKIGVTGKKAEEALGRAGIVANRDPIPFDTRPSMITSGIRVGTPAVTTRGFGKDEMKQIASMIVKVITNIDNQDIQEQVRQEVSQLCSRFPLPGIDK